MNSVPLTSVPSLPGGPAGPCGPGAPLGPGLCNTARPQCEIHQQCAASHVSISKMYGMETQTDPHTRDSLAVYEKETLLLVGL